MRRMQAGLAPICQIIANMRHASAPKNVAYYAAGSLNCCARASSSARSIRYVVVPPPSSSAAGKRLLKEADEIAALRRFIDHDFFTRLGRASYFDPFSRLIQYCRADHSSPSSSAVGRRYCHSP